MLLDAGRMDGTLAGNNQTQWNVNETLGFAIDQNGERNNQTQWNVNDYLEILKFKKVQK